LLTDLSYDIKKHLKYQMRVEWNWILQSQLYPDFYREGSWTSL